MTPEERFERIERSLERAAERADRADERADRADERADRADERADRFDARLNRAIRLAVREARAERERRRKANAEFDEKMTQLAAAQLINEEGLKDLQAMVKAFIASLQRGGNGHG